MITFDYDFQKAYENYFEESICSITGSIVDCNDFYPVVQCDQKDNR